MFALCRSVLGLVLGSLTSRAFELTGGRASDQAALEKRQAAAEAEERTFSQVREAFQAEQAALQAAQAA